MTLKGAKKKWADDHVDTSTTLLVDDTPVTGTIKGYKEVGENEVEFTLETSDEQTHTFTAQVPSTDAEVKRRAEARQKVAEEERAERRKAALEAEADDSEDS